MKYIFIVFIILGLGGSLSPVFAIDYKDSVKITETPKEPNTASNISRAKLLCTHVGNFKSNVTSIANKYDLDDDITIEKTLGLVERMYDACMKIQTLDIEKSDADNIIASIVTDLGVLNTGIKDHLKLKIEAIEKQHERYSNMANKISYHLDILIEKLRERVKQRGDIGSRERNILYYVSRLEEHSKKLKNFGNIEFYKISEMKSALIRIIRDIKKEIQTLRSI